jgi:hypothetical protein
MATVAFTAESVQHVGNRKEVTGTITLTGSYVSGGEAVPGSLFGLELALDDLKADPAVVTGGVFPTRWDKANSKLLLHGLVDATPAANEAGPQLAAAAIPGGPATVRCTARGLGTAA